MKKYLLLFLYILQVFCSFAQVCNYQLGSYELKSSGIKKDLLFKAALGHYDYHNEIGGVSFEQIATPYAQIAGQSIQLHYSPEKPDSLRLQITIGSSLYNTFTPNIPDWQLIPIAYYANDTNHAVFTILHDIKDSTIRQKDFRYHKAFSNQLLGLRMFQADLLFYEEDGGYLAELPKDSRTKETLIADSEMKLIEKKRSEKENDLRYLGLTLELSYFYTTSYILTDWGKEVRFGVNNKQFYITGEPYYLFTKVISDDSYWLNNLSITSITNYIKKHKNVDTVSLKEHPFLQDSSLASFLNSLKQGIYSWTMDSLLSLTNNLKNRYNNDRYIDYLTPKYNNYGKIELLLGASQEIEKYYNRYIYEFNPVVFHSCITTMRYAAFFRYVKQNYPEAWRIFMEEIKQFEGKFINPSANNDALINKGIITPTEMNIKND